MTLEEGLDAPDLSSHHGHHHHHHLMDWLEDSISFLPAFLNEPYSVPEEVVPCEWWVQDENQSFTAAAAAAAAVAAVSVAPPIAFASAKPEPLPETPKSELPKKRKLSARQTAGESGEANNGSKKGHGRGGVPNSGGVCCGGGSKEVRWAEQLLNPLAAAIDAANVSRIQHLTCVLQELASPTGDANHRLAFHGLRALSRRFSSSSSPPTTAYASADPRLFRSALIKFHEVSAWFAFPNCLANAAILQAAAMGGRVGGGPGRSGILHVVDVGVSHGLQWPTLMEALTRRGAQGLVKLTVTEAGSGGPFGSAPAGYDFVPQLLRYAKSIDLNLRVERGEVGRGPGKEIMVVCLQFRAGRVGSWFWKAVRETEPDLLVLTEMEEGMGGGAGGGGERGFGRRAEMLWRFLESTSAAFKGRDSEERRVVEGEAARLLEEERGELWREKMEGEGFRKEGFGEEAVEAGRALLKKYDGNWEMKIGGDGAVGLSWRGKIVSFCSLWKPACKTTAGGVGGGGGGRRH